MPSSSAGVFARRRAADGLLVDLERDPVVAQPVGERDRQVAGHDGALDLPAPDGAQRHLQLGLGAVGAVGEHLVEPEVVEQDELGVGQGLADAGRLERAGEDRGAAVLDHDQQRVDDLQRDLVADGRVANGVAVEQDRRHPAKASVWRMSAFSPVDFYALDDLLTRAGARHPRPPARVLRARGHAGGEPLLGGRGVPVRADPEDGRAEPRRRHDRGLRLPRHELGRGRPGGPGVGALGRQRRHVLRRPLVPGDADDRHARLGGAEAALAAGDGADREGRRVRPHRAAPRVRLRRDWRRPRGATATASASTGARSGSATPRSPTS